MDLETADKVSKLLEQKTKYEKDLAQIYSKDFKFSICATRKITEDFMFISPSIDLQINDDKDLLGIVKSLVIKELYNKIESIDEKIKNITL